MVTGGSREVRYWGEVEVEVGEGFGCMVCSCLEIEQLAIGKSEADMAELLGEHLGLGLQYHVVDGDILCPCQ